MPKYIIYCRKSTESEEKQVMSIDSQLKELENLSNRLNLPIAVVLTESKSAKLPGRPVFNEMMKKISNGQYSGVVCWKLDRLARNPIDGTAVVWALDQGKIKEIITPHGSFKNSSNDKFMMQIEFGMAKKYVDDLSDNVKRGLRAKLERGWLPSLPPLGYLNEPKERIIIKDPERFSLIQKAWDLLLEGYSPSKILKMLNEEWEFRTRPGTKLGGRPLCLSNLYKIFGNPFYYGLIKRKEGVYPGKHERMITEEKYWTAQAFLGRKGRPRSKKHEFAFSGLIRCEECGCMITAEEKVNQYGNHYTYYHCTKKKPSVPCHQKYIDLMELERQFIGILQNIHVPQMFLDMALNYLKEKEGTELNRLEDIRKSQEKALSGYQKKLDNLNQMRLNDLINDEEYISEKRRLLENKTTLELRLGNNSWKSSYDLTKEVFVLASQACGRFLNGTWKDKRSVIRDLRSNFFLKDKTLIIRAQKPLQIIESGIREVQGGNPPLEPRILSSIIEKKKDYASVIRSWCARVEDVRTFYEARQEVGT